MKRKTIFLLLLVLITINSVVYIVTKINEKQRVDLTLKDNIKTLQTHYEILLHSQETTAKTIYISTLKMKNFINIMTEANRADKKQKAILRKQLQEILQEKYEIIKMKDVLQYQFVLLNNESFLRMHKPSKFGDNLTDVRADFKYVSEFKKPIRGFTQGKTSHGFRNTFPILDKNSNYIGAMEVSFSSDSFQKDLTLISQMHSHFLVRKDIFDAKTWARDDLVVKYQQSAEHPNYMITMTKQHTQEECIIENKNKLVSVASQINSNELKGKSFAVYVVHYDHVDVISFLPIKNINAKVVAWLVSYEENKFIEMTLKGGTLIRIISFLASLILVYFIIQQIKSREKIQQEHNLLNEVLSTTEDIIFVTNFKEVIFSNKKFKELLNIEHSSEYNKNVLDMFVVSHGYLHKELLEEGENFVRLIQRTAENERVVSIIDKHFSIKAFIVDIVQINYQNYDDYLVTLTDITTMKERQVLTEKKAYFDGLTKVYNRYKFDEIINNEINNAQRYHRHLSMAILDIDKFKNFNDVYGHLIGDEVLIMLAQHVKNSIRGTDTFARWGGEEFVILFKESDTQQAKMISEKIRGSISELEHETAGRITASFGVTEFKDGDTLKTMFKRCDEALYKAKEAGRNRVEVL